MNKRLLLAAVVSFASALLFPAAARAQVGPPPGAIGDKNLRDEADPTRARSVEMERVKRDADKPEDKAAPSFPQIMEDFERIQIINSDVLQAGAPGSAPDYRRISEAASEIKKRAARLSSNLFPPETEKQSKGKNEEAEEPQDLKSLLSAVDGAIISFVNNPIFQNTKVVNPEDSAKARRDLDKVIKLSTRISKEADKLKKAGG
jgi:hypothetical protein